MDLRRLAVSLIILIVGLGILFYLSKSQSRPRPAQETKAPAPSIPPATSGPTGTPVVPAPIKTTPVITSAPGKPEIRWFGTQAELEYVTIGSLNAKDCLVQLQLASEGAGIYTAKLSEYFVTVADKQLYNRDPNGYQAKRQANPEKYKGRYSLLNPVPLPDGRLLPLATRSLFIQIEGEPNSNFAIEDLNRRPWQLEESNETSARFSYTLYRGKNRQEAMDHPVLKLFKTYEVHKGDYSVSVSLAAENLFGKPVRIWLDQLGPTGVPEEDLRADTHGCLRDIQNRGRQGAGCSEVSGGTAKDGN